jgi:hypothetical protein
MDSFIEFKLYSIERDMKLVQGCGWSCDTNTRCIMLVIHGSA